MMPDAIPPQVQFLSFPFAELLEDSHLQEHGCQINRSSTLCKIGCKSIPKTSQESKGLLSNSEHAEGKVQFINWKNCLWTIRDLQSEDVVSQDLGHEECLVLLRLGVMLSYLVETCSEELTCHLKQLPEEVSRLSCIQED